MEQPKDLPAIKPHAGHPITTQDSTILSIIHQYSITSTPITDLTTQHGISTDAFYDAVGRDDALSEQYRIARAKRAHAALDGLHTKEQALEQEITVSDNDRKTDLRIRLHNVRSRNVQWWAERVARADYGQQVQIDVGMADPSAARQQAWTARAALIHKAVDAQSTTVDNSPNTP
jgi:hypothetical protein